LPKTPAQPWLGRQPDPRSAGRRPNGDRSHHGGERMPYLWDMPPCSSTSSPTPSRLVLAALALLLGLSACSTQKLILDPRKAPAWRLQPGLAPCWARTVPIQLNLPEFPRSYEVPRELAWRFNLRYRARNPLLAPGLRLETRLVYDACRTDSALPSLELSLRREGLDSATSLDSIRLPIGRERGSDLATLLDAMHAQGSSGHAHELRLVAVNGLALAPWARALEADFLQAQESSPRSRFQRDDSTWQWLHDRAWSDPALRHTLSLRLFLGRSCRGCFAIEDTIVLDQDSLRISRAERQP